LQASLAELEDLRINPVTKVVNLLTDMKIQVEKEADEDKEIYEKMDCWCKTNDREKSRALEIAEEKINELEAFIEESAAKVAQLEGEIEKLKEDIAANIKALEKATAMREKEAAEFSVEEKDMMDVVSALEQALEILGKVQLMQKNGKLQEAGNALMQLKKTLKKSIGGSVHFKDVMQKDLWDMLSSFGGSEADGAFMRPRTFTGFEQTEEGDDQPIEGGGGIAGAKSYNSRSGQIFGMLGEMKDEFTRNLSEAQKQELAAVTAFAEMKAAKESEIAAAKASVDSKSEELADTNLRMAEAKQDLEDTTSALSADQKFLLDLKKRCAESDEQYVVRQKERQDEVIAISETIKILTDDDARDLMSNTVGFLQVSAVTHSVSSDKEKKRLRRQRNIRAKEATKLFQLAKQYGDWGLAQLAVSTQLDGFEKVKKAMDDMTAELKKQQAEEVKKNDFCKVELDKNEDTIKTKGNVKEDLETKIQDLEGTVESLTASITALKAENAEMHIQLKRAGEDRAAENKEFQQVVADQRATVVILNKALDRLRQFYAPKGAAALMSVKEHEKKQEPVPGAAAPPPPPAGKAYEKSGGGGGVMHLIQMIIEEAKRADEAAVKDEQGAQTAYASLVSETNNSLAANSKEIVNKSEAKAQADMDHETAKQDLDTTMAALETLSSYNGQLHTDCDYILKNFDLRQTARQAEIDAIVEAKAILSGADFS